jgi:AraC family transcriptional regulator of adaptative response/methylated-DNA-[protein]-cysteine methyltransferase
MLYRREISSPLGSLIVLADAKAVRLIDFHDRRDIDAAMAKLAGAGQVSDDATPLLERACAELSAYFAGESASFSFPLAPAGTAFQQAVWAKLLEIPPGETWSYGQQARALGNGPAVRAVARANGQNFCCIVIPCHRVIGAGGSLTGYGGGLERKRWLLDHERKHFTANADLFAAKELANA